MSGRYLDLLETLARLSDAEMSAPWRWPGREGGALQVRDAHWKVYELELAALAAAPPPAGEAAALADEAEAAFGDLRGLLAGLSDSLLDAAPGGGEWTLRETLAHVLSVDRSYTAQIRHAVTRRDDEPVYISPPRELPDEDRVGGVRAWLERLAVTRRVFDDLARPLPPAALTRPTVWAKYDVDVRFRLGRTAAHLAEHTIQVEKVLRALDRPPAEARQAARRISALRGRHEFRTPVPELAGLDTRQHDLAASIDLAL